MYDRRTRMRISACLADAFLAGAWSEPLLVERAGEVLEPGQPWFADIAREVLAAYHRPPSDRPRELAAFIALQLEGRRPHPAATPPRVRRWLLAELAMGRRPWPVPELPSLAARSPALANLATFRLDRRLAGLAGALGATYSRYADDLTISGPRLLAQRAAGVRATIATIAREEGFAVNERKSRLTTRAGRQRVCGVVVNDGLNVARIEYDLLKATLHNAARHGPAGQNRTGASDFRAHLLGRIAWVESLHPARGEKLRRQFARIAWDA